MIFYFCAAVFMATVFCYFIFVLKIHLQNQAIKDLDVKMQGVGTDEQKEQEKTVAGYQKKINDYALLVKDHRITSNALGFLEKNTLPDVWFYQFSMRASENKVDISGEAENMDTLSRQTSVFEKSELV